MKKMSVRNYLKILYRQAVSIHHLITFNREKIPQKSYVLSPARIFFSTDVKKNEICNTTGVDDVTRKKSFFVWHYLWEYFKTDPKYKKLIYIPKASIPENSSIDTNNFKKFFNYPALTSSLEEHNLNNMSLDQVLDVVHLASKCYEKTKNPSYCASVFECLDKHLIYRSLQSEEILKCLSLIQQCSCSRYFSFYSSSLCKLLSKVKNLPKEQVVLLLFLMVKLGESKIKEKKYNLYSKILEITPDLKLEELAVIFLGTSKLSCKINNYDLMPAVVEVIENNIEKLDSLLLKVLCEGLEQQNMNKHSVLYNNFQEKMIPHISKFHPASLVCLLLINKGNNQINVTLAENVFKIVRENINLCSTGILEKIMSISSYYNIYDQNLTSEAIKEFEFMVEHLKPIKCQKCLLQFLSHLAVIEVYPENLLNYAMNPEFITNLITERQTISITYWNFLNCSLKIEKPEYHCAIKDDQIEKHFHKTKIYLPQIILRLVSYQSNQVKSQSTYYNMCYIIEGCLKEIYGNEKVLWFAPLCHHQEIILMIFNKDLKPEAIPDNIKVVKSREQKIIKPSDDRFWVSFIIVSAAINFLRRNNELNCYTKSKIRQFNKVGYKPILVVTNELTAHKKNNSLGKYLIDKIDEQLKQLVEQKAKES